jgi:predicted permease
MRAWRRLRYLLHRDRHESDLREEMNFHRELSGRAAFGNDALAVSQSRDVWIAPWLQDASQDVRFAIRMLLKDRRFTLAAITALALGMGVNLSVFIAMDAAILRDVPFEQPDRLLRIRTVDATGNDGPTSWADLQDWREQARSFRGLAAETGGVMNISEPDILAERLRGAYVSANTFDLLGVAPALGRGFTPADDEPGAPAVVIISGEVWRRRYGSDPGVLGRAVKINDTPATVVGVMPDWFRFPFITQAWQPLIHAPALSGGAARRDVRTLSVVGRLADGVRPETALAELQAIVASLAVRHPETNAKTRAAARAMKADIAQTSSPMLLTMMAAVGLVLLIACANLAALLLARSTGRGREIAIRAALGASRWRIVRQLLTECALLAAVAAQCGLALGRYGAGELAVAFSPIEAGVNPRDVRPYWLDLSIDAWTALFVVGLSAIATFAIGLAPALHLSKTRVHEALKDGGRGGGIRRARRWTAGLMVAQVAMTVILLTSAGLLWRRFVEQYQADPGIETSGLLLAQASLAGEKYRTPQSRQQFFEALGVKLASERAFSSATLASQTPIVGPRGAPRRAAIEGREQPLEAGVTSAAVGPRFFETLGLQMLAGRGLTEADARRGEEGVVIDRSFAAHFFGNQNPVGRRLRIVTATPPRTETPWLTVVGVTADLPGFGPGGVGGTRPVAYVPLALDPGIRSAAIIVRTASLENGIAALREAVRSVDPDLPLFALHTMDTALATTRFPARLLGTWASTLASIALVVAAVGMFALTAHAVAQRRHEIGVRLALGARPRAVVWGVMQRAVRHSILGLLIGVVGAIAAGPLLAFFLGGTSPRDPVTLGIVSVLLVTVSVVATVLPARRAARIDPAATLRAD